MRGSIVQLTVFALIAAVISTAVAVLIPWLPLQASREAGRIDFAYWFMTGISIFVFSLVVSPMAYALWKFRVKPGDLSDGPPIHGHTLLEILWTAIPFALVTAVAVMSAVVLAENGRGGANPLQIKVVGQQFAWTFIYPNGTTHPVLRLPLRRSAELSFDAKDVLHSFWVPEFRQKEDLVPGLDPTHIIITPTKTGTFPVICVELCGLGHSTMRSEAIVLRPEAYDTWYAGSKQSAQGAGAGQGAASGSGGNALATFNDKGCGACHTFTAAKSTGKIGPDLDNTKADAQKAGQPLDEFIHTSIVEPDAYVPDGYQKGVMPSFKGQIPPGELDALVQYLATNAK